MQDMKVTIFLASFLVLAVSGILSSGDLLGYHGNAYAQSPPGAGSSPDIAVPGDNSSAFPGDNSTGPGADLGIPPDNTTDIGPGPAQDNVTVPATHASASQSSTVPEFGPAASLILVASIVSIIAFSARARLRL